MNSLKIVERFEIDTPDIVSVFYEPLIRLHFMNLHN